MTMLQLPDRHHQHWRDALEDRLQDASPGPIDLDCRDWLLTCSDLQQLITIASARGYTLQTLLGQRPETIVSAQPSVSTRDCVRTSQTRTQPPLHRHRQVKECCSITGPFDPATTSDDRDVLLYGDVNPGADQCCWTRPGVGAPAGDRPCRTGRRSSARIVALQLRPLSCASESGGARARGSAAGGTCGAGPSGGR